jgi:hypothetical protein
MEARVAVWAAALQSLDEESTRAAHIDDFSRNAGHLKGATRQQKHCSCVGACAAGCTAASQNSRGVDKVGERHKAGDEHKTRDGRYGGCRAAHAPAGEQRRSAQVQLEQL